MRILAERFLLYRKRKVSYKVKKQETSDASCKKSSYNDFLRRHYPHQVKGSKFEHFLSACYIQAPLFLLYYDLRMQDQAPSSSDRHNAYRTTLVIIIHKKEINATLNENIFQKFTLSILAVLLEDVSVIGNVNAPARNPTINIIITTHLENAAPLSRI